MKYNPKDGKPGVSFEEAKQQMSKQLAIILVFLGTFGFFVKIVFL